MDGEGNVLAEHQGERNADGFSQTGQKPKEYVSLKAKAEKGDKAAKIDFIIAQLSVGQLKPAEADAKIKEAGTPTKEQLAKLDGELVNASVVETMKTVEDEDSAKAAGKKFYEAEKAGKPWPTSDQAMQPYYILMMKAAEEAKDAAIFEKAMNALKKKFGDNPNAKRFFEANEKKLEELKKK